MPDLFFRKLKIRPSLLSPNRAKMPLKRRIFNKFYLLWLKLIRKTISFFKSMKLMIFKMNWIAVAPKNFQNALFYFFLHDLKKFFNSPLSIMEWMSTLYHFELTFWIKIKLVYKFKNFSIFDSFVFFSNFFLF